MIKLLQYLVFLLCTIYIVHGGRFRRDDEGHDDHESHHYHSDYEPHEFDHDPHQDDSEYDEDVLTGTSHHAKKSKEEIKKELDELFVKIDKNNDKKITKQELIAHLIESMKKLHNESTHEEFDRVDTNKDNKVSLDEYFIYEHGDPVDVMDNLTKSENSTETQELKKRMDAEKERFKAADNNGDKVLDVSEYLLFKYPVFYPHMAHTVVHEYLQDLDANHDGMVDLKEYVEHFHIPDNKNKTEADLDLKKAKEDFEKYDKDKNGKIDTKEYFAILRPGYESPAEAEADYLIKESDGNKDDELTLAEVEKHSQIWLGGEPLGSDAANIDDDEDDHDDDEEHDEL